MTIPDYSLPYCTITGTFVAVDADSADPNLTPDVQPLNGTITLTPTTNAGRVDDAFAQIRSVTVRVFGGQIVDDEDLPGVRILATDANIGVADWAWRATFKFDGLSLDPLPFKAPRDTTVNLTSGLVPIKSQPYQIVEGASIVDAEEDGAGNIRFTLSNGEATRWLDIPNGEKGEKGDRGDAGQRGADGESPALSIGAVSSGAVADAWMSGPALNRTLNLTLPRGAKGEQGEKGEPGTGGGNMEGLSGIRVVTVEEYEGLTPDPTILYVVTGASDPDPSDPDPEPVEVGTIAEPVFGRPSIAGSSSAATSLVVPRPAGVHDGDLVVVALRSQGSDGTLWTAPSGFLHVSTLVTGTTTYVASRTGAVFVKPVSDLDTEPSTYTFSGPSGRNVAISVRLNIGTLDVSSAATGLYGGEYSAGLSTVPAHSLARGPALSLVAMGAESTAGISGVPSKTPEGFEQIAAAQSSLDGSTAGSRTALWLGWRALPTAAHPEMTGGYAGASAPGIYPGAIA